MNRHTDGQMEKITMFDQKEGGQRKEHSDKLTYGRANVRDRWRYSINR